MNKKQKVILILGIAIIVLMCLYPPTEKYIQLGQTNNISPYYHYGFFFQVLDHEIELTKLTIQIFVAAVVTGGLISLAASKKVVEDEDKKDAGDIEFE